MINSNRIKERFTMLAQIDSISKEEAQIASKLKEILTEMGAEVTMDNVTQKLMETAVILLQNLKETALYLL